MAGKVDVTRGDWEIVCRGDDGGRLDRLRYRGTDLLTCRPRHFEPPAGAEAAAYEQRPVYGYDDCFPSYLPCPFPGRDWPIPDHGELCWLSWDLERTDDGLVCRTASEVLPVRFERRLQVAGHALHWYFAAHNDGPNDLPLLHVMNPLMSLQEVENLTLPAYGMRIDELRGRKLPFKEPPELARDLLATDHGTCRRLLLRNVKEGRVTIGFHHGLRLTMHWKKSIFPTLGIWWNNAGYPDQDGLRRAEFALQPVTGPASSLAESCTDGKCLFLGPRRSRQWEVSWTVEQA